MFLGSLIFGVLAMIAFASNQVGTGLIILAIGVFVMSICKVNPFKSNANHPGQVTFRKRPDAHRNRGRR